MFTLRNRSVTGYGAADTPNITLDGGMTYPCTIAAFMVAREACRSGATVNVAVEGDIVRQVSTV